MDEEFHNCCEWSQLERQALENIIKISFDEGKAPIPEPHLLQTLIGRRHERKPATNQNGPSKRQTITSANQNHNFDEHENSWEGMNDYKMQKYITMYPKNFDREYFLLKEVYRRLVRNENKTEIT